MAFDPTLPFEEVDEFEPVNEELALKPTASSFDINQPFEEVDESSIGTKASVPSQYKYDPARFRPRGLKAKAEEKPEEQGILRQVADIPLGIARGGVTGIKMMTDILGADNAVSKSLSGIEGYMADLMSAQAKEDQQEISRIMKDAEDKGFGEQVKAGIKAFSIAPVDIMSQALGTMAPVIAGGLVGSAAKLGALGMRAVQAGVGAGMGAGMIKGEIYNEVKNELVNSGIAEDAAEKAAVEAQSYGGKNLDQILLGAGLGAASTLGAEGIITRILTKQGTAPAAGVVSRVLKGGLTEAAPEAAQAAQEQLAKNVALQREGFDVDPSRGVVAAATMEAVAAAPLGGIAGAVERPAPIKTLAEENLEQTNEIARKVAENGAPLTASAIQDQAATNLRQDELAKQLEAQLEEELVAVKEPTAAPPAIKSKEEFTAIYSQVAPEELDAAEAGFTNVLATAATEEARANAQNALEVIKEVKATITPPAPPVEPTITPAVTPAVTTAQPPITYATQEIIQPEGVRPELETGTQIETQEAGVSDSLQPPARGEEEGQVIFGLQSVADNTATREQISALSEAGLVDIVKGKPVINEDGAAILAQPAAPAIVEQEAVTTPAPEEAVTPAPIAEAPVVAPAEAPAPEVASARLYLNVPFNRKEGAKSAGAKFDAEKKLWYIERRPTGELPPISPSFIQEAETTAFTAKELEPARINAQAQLGQEIEVDSFDTPGGTAYGLKVKGGDWINKNINLEIERAKTKVEPIAGGGTEMATMESQPSTPGGISPDQKSRDAATALGKVYPFKGINNASEQKKFLSKAKAALAKFGVKGWQFDSAVETIKSRTARESGGKVSYVNDRAIYTQLVKDGALAQPTPTPAVSETITEPTPVENVVGKKVTDSMGALPQKATKAREALQGYTPIFKIGDFYEFIGEEAGLSGSTVVGTGKSARSSLPYHQVYKLQEIANKTGKPIAIIANTKVAEVITPAVSETITEEALEVAPIQRDVTKPEQMTPEEISKTLVNKKMSSGVGVRLKGLNRKSYILGVEAGARREHRAAITDALESQSPVSTEAVDAYGITIPVGYTKQGDLYVYQPTPAVSETITEPAAAPKAEARQSFVPPIVRSMLEAASIASKAWSDARSEIRKQLTGTKESIFLALARDDFKLSRKGNIVYASIPKGGSDAFSINAVADSLDKYFRFGDGKGLANVSKQAGKPFEIKFKNEEDAKDFLVYKGRTPEQVDEEFKRIFQELEERAMQEMGAPAPEAAPEGVAVGNRIKLGKSPQTYTIEEVIPQTANDKKPVGARKRRMAAKPTPLPDNERYGQVKLNRRVQSYFGGKIPDRVYVVDDAVDPEYEYKAAYYPDEGILILNNAFIRKNENIGDIIAHELGHYAFGDAKFKAAFDEFYNSLTPEEKADIDQLMGDSYNNETEESQMEERKVIAFTSFTIATPQRRSLWNAVLDAMKAFLNRVFGKNFKMSDPTRTALAMLATAKRRFAAGEEIVREDIQARKMAAQTQDARFAELEARAKAGDKEAEAEAQMMVDEAAKAAGYDIQNVYHASTTNFNEFLDAQERAEAAGEDPYDVDVEAGNLGTGFYFTPDKTYANRFGKPRKFHLRIKNTLDVTDEDVIRRGREIQEEEGLSVGDVMDELMREDKADGAFGESVGGLSYGASEYLIKKSNQAKLADPFTYDDAGNLIPLSERFQPTTPDIRRMAVEAEPTEATPAQEARREQFAGMKIGRIITTPPGIKQKTTDIIRSKFFDSTKVSPENTSQAWAYISQFMDNADNSNNKFAGHVNNVTESELPEADKRGIDESFGAVMLQVELSNYASRLAAQGYTKMLSYMIRNGNRMPTGEYLQGIRKAGQDLNAVKGRLKDESAGFAAFDTEFESNVERLASTIFGTNNPNKDQIAIAQQALTESDTIELGDAIQVADDIKKVETRTNKSILQKIDDLISGYDNPKKDQLLLIFANLIRSRDVDGITISYKPAKVSISDRIANLLVKNLANYRDTLVDKAASGLESTFWRTMSSQENKPGLLGELDQAQNNELAKIVKATLIKMKLAGEPKNTKMTDIEKVASILNESKLSEEKRIEADKRIVEEIDRRRQEELSTTKNPDAVNAKYDSILKAWNDSMSRQLNMPVSDSMLQRLISSEMKEQSIKIRDLVDEADGKVVVEKKQNIINSIIRKIYGVSKESEMGIEMDENYEGLKSYLEQTLENMYALSVEEKNAAYAKRQAKMSLRNTAESQAQSIINRLADQLSDTPAFPEKQENEVKAIVQQDLKQIPDMNRKQPWTSQLTAKLMRAGVSETQAQIISDLVWRQHEIKTMDRESKELQTAAEKGSLAVIIDRIKNTPLEKQQSPEWKQEVIKEYLREAGLSSKAAETAAKLYDSVISERLAEAKQKAFEETLSRSAPWKDYQARNSRLAKDALDKIRVAIRTGVLDPEQTTEAIIARENGWTGFTKEQYQRIVQLDSIINNPENDDVSRREAMAQLNQIIVDAKLPVRFKDALGAYYVGNALMGIPTGLVNLVSPAGFAIRNMLTDIGRYAFTDPARIPIAFETFLDSMRSWYNQTSYAFKNQIYLNDVVEYLQGQNVLRELFDKGKKQWANGEYAAGFVNMAVGMTQITGRVLSSLDQGAIAMLENQNITRYAMEALAGNTKGKIPKDKLKEFANMVLHTKRKVITESVANGMSRDRAGVLADLAVKSEIIAALSTTKGGPKDVLDAAINDALLSVGRNKTITINGITKETKNLRDAGILSYWPIGILEGVSEYAGREGSGMQIFAKMLYGFALVPARVFHNVAWFSPYGFLRLGIDAYKKNRGQDSPYAMSLQTDAQFKQRLTEAIAGSIVMIGLMALRAGSSDDEDDKKFRIVITGNGPSAATDKQYYDSWHKKWKPYSIHIVIGDTIIPINIGRGGEALFFPILMAGAMDDWEIKKKQNDTKKSPEDLNMAASVLGSAFFALAQRGPYAAFGKSLFDGSKQGRITEELASQAGYFGKTFIPVLGTSVARNITDFINDPVDRSSIEGAIYANTPIVGPWMGAKALNALGQPARADDWGDKLYKLGVPVVFSFPKDTPMNELNELILKQGSGPTFPTRTNAQKRFGDILTDKEFETYVREYGKVMSDRMFKNRTKLARMKPSDYDDELEKYARGYSAGDFKIKGASDAAVQAVKRMRQ